MATDRHSLRQLTRTQSLLPHGVLRLRRVFQVTFDYCYVRYDKEVQQCLCGHSKCVQTLGTRRSEEDAEGGSGRGLNIGGGEASQGTGVRGSGGRASPKWQDPETGDRVRPWLHLEDAEVSQLDDESIA